MKKSKSEEFSSILDGPKVCLKSLKSIAFQGCPFEGSTRALTWKLLLNYLPPKRDLWTSELECFRNHYRDYIVEFIERPGSKMEEGQNDHPLNPDPGSQWAAFFKDNEMLLQIYKDCRRLCPDLNFFQQPTEYPCSVLVGSEKAVDTLRKRVEYSALQSETLARSRSGLSNLVCTGRARAYDNEDYVHLEPGQEAHWEVVERILFLYCKMNHAQSYVQGMNEVAGPIYYVFANDPDPEWRKYAEPDAFFCFVNLMTEIQHNFIKTLDHDIGIGPHMKKVMSTLRRLDYALWARMEEQKMMPEYFAFRWITLLLSQEFNLPDVLRVWDSLFSDENRFDFLIYVCCGMLILIREELMENDFSHAMKLVQHYPIEDVHLILAKANELYMRRTKD